MKVDREQLRIVEDSTFATRTVPERESQETDGPLVRELRRRFDAAEYEGVLELASANPADCDARVYESMALRKLDRLPESLVPALLAVALATDPWRQSVALNLVATRLLHLHGDRACAERLFFEAWRVNPAGTRNGWNPVANRCELVLQRARDGDLAMEEALGQVDEAFGELLANFPGWADNRDFVLYMKRQFDLAEYRSSSYWKARFGHLI